MDDFLLGKKLRGDDFTDEQLKAWFEDEKEGYAGIVKGYEEPYLTHFRTHLINTHYLFKHLPKGYGWRVLGIGSAYGGEFEPIRDRIEQLYILEPSEEFSSHASPKQQYFKPRYDGVMEFPDNYFDLVVCLGVLHHIPNTSFVVSEIFRCLKPGGYFLTREPIYSMGDWSGPRHGLTKNERGIPIAYFRNMIKRIGFKVIREDFLFTGTWALVRKTSKWLTKEIYEYKLYLIFDKFISKLLRWNIHYHARNKFQRIAPTSVSFVLKKENQNL